MDLARLPNLRGVADVIYNPLRTRLIQQAQALGIPCEGGLSMLVYQAGMADSMKKIMELLKGNAEEQTRGVERIVAQVMETLEYSMGASFASLGDTMRSAGEAQMAYAESGRQLTEAAEKLLDSSRAPPGLGGSGDGAPGGLCQRVAGAEGGPGSSLPGDD